ncbi:MAG: hypothetical protein AAF690_19420 [Acidobacteriota bacterium]
MNRFAQRLVRGLESPVTLWALPLLGAAVLCGALDGGFQLDDHFQRYRLLGLGEDSMQLFVFYDGDVDSNLAEREAGTLPWWVSPKLRHANFRYLSVLTMQLDYLLWPHSPALMHLHSLLWLAALVLVVTAFFRYLFRESSARWVAGLAALVYALDDAHVLPAGYLANRNALLAAAFGLASVYCHTRWREEQWRPGFWLTPLFLSLAFASGELGVSALAYLFAYAVCLDREGLRAASLALVPSGLVATLWMLTYRFGGFGSSDSGLYVDPGADPLGFLSLSLDRISALLLGQWTPIPADWTVLVGPSGAGGVRAAGVLIFAGLASLLWPQRSQPLLRFFALGSFLSLLPIAATGPQNRLLLFVSFGAAGLLGCLAAARPSGWRRWVLVGLVAMHLTLSIAAGQIVLTFQERAARAMEVASNSVPDEGLETKELVLVNPSDSIYLPTAVFMMRWTDGRPAPHTIRVLSHGSTDVEVEGVDPNTVELELAQGLFPDAMSRYHRSSRLPFVPGDRVELEGFSAEVLEVGSTGDPTRLRYRFSSALGREDQLWLVWNGATFERWRPPKPGETKLLPRRAGIFG